MNVENIIIAIAAVLALAPCGAAEGNVLKTSETSKLFVKHVARTAIDPDSFFANLPAAAREK